MDIYELVGFQSGINRAGINFLAPEESFQTIRNGYVYRQELKSRKGFTRFSSGRLAGGTRIMGIFEMIVPGTDSELLVADKDYLYRYNNTTDTFVQIAFNSAVTITSLGITSPDAYVTGTTYLDKDGSSRFVFTGSDMSDIFFYDGTDVKRFTNTTDNPDYSPPSEGALTRAVRIRWFGERLNFFAPTIGGDLYAQGVLYSGIRDSSGNGDKFNVAGSGIIEADTYEIMKGAVQLGDLMIMNFDKSNWSLEKTKDPYNPYYVRKIPSVLGTDAGFSAVEWNYEVKSAGKTGFISTDGRQTLRFDNKIPYFTQDDIDNSAFSYTYGGFDRINGQFMFSYRSLGSDLGDDTQDKILIYNYEESTWSINDQRLTVFGETDKGEDLAWDDIDETKNPAWARWDTTTEIWNKIGLGEHYLKTIAGDNDGFIYEINKDADDYFVDISDITAASQAVLTVTESAFKEGDEVIVYNVKGMTEINGITAIVQSATSTAITLNIDSSDFSAYTSGGSVSKLIDFRAQSQPFNPYRPTGRSVYVSHIEFLVNREGGEIQVDIMVDDEDNILKTAYLIPDVTLTKPRQWISVAVNQEADFLTFKLQRKSYLTQTVISSIRIYCEPGDMKNG